MLKGAAIGAAVGAAAAFVIWVANPSVGDPAPRSGSDLAKALPVAAGLGGLIGLVIGSETGRPKASPEAPIRLFADPGAPSRFGAIIAF